MSRTLAFLPLAVLAALAILFVGFALRHDPHVTPAALVGRPAPAVVLAPLDGGAATPLRAGTDGPVLVNFFASWCGPCIEEAPALMALKAQGVRIVGVAYKDDPVATRRFLADRGDPYAAVRLDPDGRAGVEYGLSGVPESYVIDAAGRVVAKYANALTPEQADAVLDAVGSAPRAGALARPAA